jgi:hypothetical protein
MVGIVGFLVLCFFGAVGPWWVLYLFGYRVGFGKKHKQRGFPRFYVPLLVSLVGGVELTGYMDWLRFTFLATTTGLPAISVPVGLGPRGLPVGLQLIGKPRGEAALLAAARRVEIVVGGPLGPIDPIV